MQGIMEDYAGNDRKSMLENSTNHINSGCYLTTIVYKLLNYPDNNYYLNTLRYFRENVMQTDPNYFPLLMLYDIVGPEIAKRLGQDINGKDIATIFFNNYITKSVDAIQKGENKEAINIYTAMTKELAEHYEIIVPSISEVNVDNINPQTLGHGYTRKRAYNY